MPLSVKNNLRLPELEPLMVAPSKPITINRSSKSKGIIIALPLY
jgi:hypothetical protein